MKLPAHYRWSVASRVLAAAVGGYLLTSLLVVLLTVVLDKLGFAEPQSLLTLSMASFLIFAAIVMAVFHARSASGAWFWIVGTSLLAAVTLFLTWSGPIP